MQLKLPLMLRAASILTAGRLSRQELWLRPGQRFPLSCLLRPPPVRRGIQNLGACFLPAATSPEAFSGWRFLRRSSPSPWFPASRPELALWVTSSLWVE